MNTLFQALGIFGLILLLTIGIAFLQTLIARLKVESTVQLQCSTGDSEVMVINLNRYREEQPSDLKGRMDDAWKMIQDRRDFSHARWMQIQEQSRQEKESAAQLAEETVAQISQASKKGSKA
jgi:hypothetical protein